MKTQLVVICFVFFITYWQCFADAQLNSAFYPAGQAPSFYLPQAGGGLSALDLPSGYASISRVDDSESDVNYQGTLLLGPDPTNNFPLKNALQRFFSSLRNGIETIFSVIKSVLSVPITILKIIFFPITITFRIIKFGLNLIFLPVRIAWKIMTILFYPVTVVFRSMLAPEPAPFVLGLPSYRQSMYN